MGWQLVAVVCAAGGEINVEKSKLLGPLKTQNFSRLGARLLGFDTERNSG
jgi:hypothetical protein